MREKLSRNAYIKRFLHSSERVLIAEYDWRYEQQWKFSDVLLLSWNIILDVRFKSAFYLCDICYVIPLHCFVCCQQNLATSRVQTYTHWRNSLHKIKPIFFHIKPDESYVLDWNVFLRLLASLSPILSDWIHKNILFFS